MVGLQFRGYSNVKFSIILRHMRLRNNSQKNVPSDQHDSNRGDIGRNTLSFLAPWYGIVGLVTTGCTFSKRQPYVSDFFPHTRLVVLPLPLVDKLKASIECPKERFAEVRRTLSDSSCVA